MFPSRCASLGWPAAVLRNRCVWRPSGWVAARCTLIKVPSRPGCGPPTLRSGVSLRVAPRRSRPRPQLVRPLAVCRLRRPRTHVGPPRAPFEQPVPPQCPARARPFARGSPRHMTCARSGALQRGLFVGHQNIFVERELAHRATGVERPRVCRGQVGTHRSDCTPPKWSPTLGSGARPGWRASGDGRRFPLADPLVPVDEPLTGRRRPRGPPLRLTAAPSTNLPRAYDDHGGCAVAPRKSRVPMRAGVE